MKKNLCKLHKFINDLYYKNKFVQNHLSPIDFNIKIYLQILIACSFFIFCITNIISKSYYMLIFTFLGFAVNLACAVIAKKIKKEKVCSLSSIITCSVIFGYFVIYSGNDGFACLWVVLLPFISMIIMDFIIGLCSSVFFQFFLIFTFWTPIKNELLYKYNDQFCLRFPLFFLITFALALAISISLNESKYNELKNLNELQKISDEAKQSARIDPLTGLYNRRFAYEYFKEKFTDKLSSHCIIMADIDDFKILNDTYGHEFGDQVLITMSSYIKTILPQNYLKSRWGGEEFLFAADDSIKDVYKQTENLRKTISAHKFKYKNKTIHVTMTFGIAELTDTENIQESIGIADERLYKGKQNNKNCTVIE